MSGENLKIWRKSMNIGVVGVNHNLAPINVREAVSFTDTKKIEAIVSTASSSAFSREILPQEPV